MMAALIPLVTQWSPVQSTKIRPLLPQGHRLHCCAFFLKMAPDVGETANMWVCLKKKPKGSVAIARVSKDSSSEFESLLPLTSSSVLKIGHGGQLLFLSQFNSDLFPWSRVLFSASSSTAWSSLSMRTKAHISPGD